MSDDKLSDEIADALPDYSGENDRRKNSRRELNDRRGMIRYEIDKDDRRSNIERRKVSAPVKENIDATDGYIEIMEPDTVFGSIIEKIGDIFKR